MATKDIWLINTVHEFIKDFPVGTKLTAKKLGKWMIENEAIEKPNTSNKHTRSNDATWVKYVRDRATLRAQMNRFASSATFAAEADTPYEIQHIGGDNYQVCSIIDDIRMLMRKLLEQSKTGFNKRTSKINRLHKIAHSQPLLVDEVHRLEDMKADLEDARLHVTLALETAIGRFNRAEALFADLAAKKITNGN